MIEKFESYYQEYHLFSRNNRILLAVSGGKDSMAMIHLFKTCDLSFGIAHCNFQLRGEDADKDEQFVKDFAAKNKIDFYSINFDTQDYASKNGMSIQMAARVLRYEWFEKIRSENNYQYIATAHHKNDVAETMLINLTKGTGLAGLHGIKNKKGFVIRPMLCYTTYEIDAYVKENNILYREDMSNSEIKYFRNAIRHKILPELEKLNPAIIETLNTEANQFLNDELMITEKIEAEKNELFVKNEEGFKIEIKKLNQLNPLKTYLYYFFKEFGYNASNVNDIVDGLNSQSGKKYYSSTHQIVKDREHLYLSPRQKNNVENVQINTLEDLPFNYELKENTSDLKINKSVSYAYLDAEKIQFPMVLRTWQQGDSFQPYGMKGNKKVSDFLIDNKTPLTEKRHIQVLESGNQILWLVGKRIDDKFKISSSTKKILILSVDDSLI